MNIKTCLDSKFLQLFVFFGIACSTYQTKQLQLKIKYFFLLKNYLFSKRTGSLVVGVTGHSNNLLATDGFSTKYTKPDALSSDYANAKLFLLQTRTFVKKITNVYEFFYQARLHRTFFSRKYALHYFRNKTNYQTLGYNRGASAKKLYISLPTSHKVARLKDFKSQLRTEYTQELQEVDSTDSVDTEDVSVKSSKTPYGTSGVKSGLHLFTNAHNKTAVKELSKTTLQQENRDAFKQVSALTISSESDNEPDIYAEDQNIFTLLERFDDTDDNIDSDEQDERVTPDDVSIADTSDEATKKQDIPLSEEAADVKSSEITNDSNTAVTRKESSIVTLATYTDDDEKLLTPAAATEEYLLSERSARNQKYIAAAWPNTVSTASASTTVSPLSFFKNSYVTSAGLLLLKRDYGFNEYTWKIWELKHDLAKQCRRAWLRLILSTLHLDKKNILIMSLRVNKLFGFKKKFFVAQRSLLTTSFFNKKRRVRIVRSKILRGDLNRKNYRAVLYDDVLKTHNLFIKYNNFLFNTKQTTASVIGALRMLHNIKRCRDCTGAHILNKFSWFCDSAQFSDSSLAVLKTALSLRSYENSWFFDTATHRIGVNNTRLVSRRFGYGLPNNVLRRLLLTKFFMKKGALVKKHVFTTQATHFCAKTIAFARKTANTVLQQLKIQQTGDRRKDNLSRSLKNIKNIKYFYEKYNFADKMVTRTTTNTILSTLLKRVLLGQALSDYSMLIFFKTQDNTVYSNAHDVQLQYRRYLFKTSLFCNYNDYLYTIFSGRLHAINTRACLKINLATSKHDAQENDITAATFETFSRNNFMDWFGARTYFYSEERLQLVQFKPGYFRFFRRLRDDFKKSRSLKFYRQWKLTHYIARMQKMSTTLLVGTFDLELMYFLVRIRFFSTTEAAQNAILKGFVFVCGVLCKNPKLQVQKFDIVSLLCVYSLYNFIYNTWTRNMATMLKWLSRVRSDSALDTLNASNNDVFSFHNDDFKSHFVKFGSEHTLRQLHESLQDVPSYVECCYVSLSACVLFVPYRATDISKMAFRASAVGHIRMLNWKYLS